MVIFLFRQDLSEKLSNTSLLKDVNFLTWKNLLMNLLCPPQSVLYIPLQFFPDAPFHQKYQRKSGQRRGQRKSALGTNGLRKIINPFSYPMIIKCKLLPLHKCSNKKKYINPVVIYLERCLATQLYPCLFHCTYISATLNIERKSKVYMRSRQHEKSYECLIYVACPLEKKKKSAKSLV